jgi:serine/threonine protein kinase
VVHWYGITDMGTTLVMTYYEESLYNAMQIKRFSKDHISKIWKICRDILYNIHHQLVIHRDIKPHNFMLKDGDIFLIDFGLATFIDRSHEIIKTKREHVIGTPKYMSMFVHSGEEACKRDDLISLGYMILEMGLGELPWTDIILEATSEYPNTHYLHPIHQEYQKRKSWEKIKEFSSVDGMMEIVDFMKDMYE